MSKISCLYLVIVALLTGFRGNAQLSTSGVISNYMTVESRFNSQSNNASGSPFLTPDQVNGYAIFKNGSKIENVPLRYNAYQDLLEVRYKEINYIVNASDLKEFGYEDPKTHKHLKYMYLPLDDNTRGMIEILFESEIIFGTLNKIKIRYGAANGLNPGKDELQLNKSYYLITEEGRVLKISRNNKSLIEAFPDFKDVLSRYLKDKKLNIKDDNDLVQALTFYEGLKSK